MVNFQLVHHSIAYFQLECKKVQNPRVHASLTFYYTELSLTPYAAYFAFNDVIFDALS